MFCWKTLNATLAAIHWVSRVIETWLLAALRTSLICNLFAVFTMRPKIQLRFHELLSASAIPYLVAVSSVRMSKRTRRGAQTGRFKAAAADAGGLLSVIKLEISLTNKYHKHTQDVFCLLINYHFHGGVLRYCSDGRYWNAISKSLLIQLEKPKRMENNTTVWTEKKPTFTEELIK